MQKKVENLSFFSSPKKRLAGLDIFCCGFDIYTGQPVSPIFEFGEGSIQFDDMGFHPPSIQVKALWHGNSHTKTYNSLDDYTKELAASLNVNALGMFSANGELKKGSNLREGYKLWIDSKEEFLYSLTLNVSMKKMSSLLNAAFKEDLEGLPETYDKSAYKKFISTYGTHFFRDMKMGGEIWLEAEISDRSDLSKLGIQGGLNGFLSKCGGGINGSFSMQELNQTTEGKALVRYRGGEGLQSYEQWKASLKHKPAYFPSRLGSIADLFPKGNKKTNLEKALVEYLSNTHKHFLTLHQKPNQNVPIGCDLCRCRIETQRWHCRDCSTQKNSFDLCLDCMKIVSTIGFFWTDK